MSDGSGGFAQELLEISNRTTRVQLEMNASMRNSRDNTKLSELIADSTILLRERIEPLLNQARNDGDYSNLAARVREEGMEISNRVLANESSTRVLNKYNELWGSHLNSQVLSAMAMGVTLQQRADIDRFTSNINRIKEEALIDSFMNQELHEMTIKDLYNGAIEAGTFTQAQGQLMLEASLDDLRFNRAKEAASVDPFRAREQIDSFNLSPRKKQLIERDIATKISQRQTMLRGRAANDAQVKEDVLKGLRTDVVFGREIPPERFEETFDSIVRGRPIEQLSGLEKEQLLELTTMQAMQTELAEFARGTPLERRQRIVQLQQDPDFNVANVFAYELMNAHINSKVAEDPYTLAREQGITPVYPTLDLNDSGPARNPSQFRDRIEEQLGARRGASTALTAIYGRTTPPLTKTEIESVRTAYGKGSTFEKKNLIRQLVSGLGPNESVNLIRHFNQNDDMSDVLSDMALLMQLSLSGEAGVVSDIIDGQATTIENPDAHRKDVINYSRTANFPQYIDERQFRQNLRAIEYHSRGSQQRTLLSGIRDRSVATDNSDIERSTNSVLGSVVPRNGVYVENINRYAPRRALNNILDNLTLDDIDALGGFQGVPREDWVRALRAAQPISTGPGQYALRIGGIIPGATITRFQYLQPNTMLLREDGRRFSLDARPDRAVQLIVGARRDEFSRRAEDALAVSRLVAAPPVFGNPDLEALAESARTLNDDSVRITRVRPRDVTDNSNN